MCCAACKNDPPEHKGFDKKKIHKRLTESGQFTMSYDAFCKIVTKAIRNELSVQSLAPPELPPPSAVKPENKQAAPITPQRQPGIIKTGSEPFPEPRNIDPKTLI